MTSIPEYKSECTVPATQMKSLAEQSILILKVYNPYRYGWDETKKKFRSFYYFPARLLDDIVYSWDERAKIQEWDTFFLREKFWDDEAKKYAFRRITIDTWFYKIFKKVFDIDIAPSQDTTFNIWNQSMGKEVETTLWLGNTFTLRAVSSSRVIWMLEAFDLDSWVELVDGKDKLGNPAKIRPYNFEDELIKELSGKYVTFKVRGTWIDTRYTFKPGAEFSLVDNVPEGVSIEDVPF